MMFGSSYAHKQCCRTSCSCFDKLESSGKGARPFSFNWFTNAFKMNSLSCENRCTIGGTSVLQDSNRGNCTIGISWNLRANGIQEKSIRRQCNRRVGDGDGEEALKIGRIALMKEPMRIFTPGKSTQKSNEQLAIIDSLRHS